ncbi:MAG: hypothetical protein AAGD25_34350 [Cyanobacteria bacterium P01_F01_bin.150]
MEYRRATTPGGTYFFTDFATRWRLIKSNVSRVCPDEWKGDRTPSRKAKKEQAVWQRRFWEHQIRDDQDMNNHINYIHYNPIHHRLVQHLKDWPYSSFHKYVKNGQYDPNWGSDYPITFDVDVGHE